MQSKTPLLFALSAFGVSMGFCVPPTLAADSGYILPDLRGSVAAKAPTGPVADVVPIAATRGSGYHDGRYRGRTFSAYYGVVQVEADIRNGQLFYVDVLKHPSDRRTSRIINSRALPRLESEVIRAQSARVDTVSGATLTSRAFIRSLRSALDKARRG